MPRYLLPEFIYWLDPVSDMEKRALGESKGSSRQPTILSPILGRHKALLNDPKVRSWWEARSLRSRLSADQYLRQFGFLLERLELTPERVVGLAKKNPDRLRDLLIRDAAKLKNAGRLDSYIGKFTEGLKSYFRFHRVSFDGFPSLSPIKGASLANERIPTPDELNRVLERLSLRPRVCALFMAHAGLRPGVLGAYRAEGGLTLADLPDLKLGKEPEFTEVPFVVRVPAGLSKTRVSYVTFGSSHLASTFLVYLTERKAGGEELSPSSPVVAVRTTRGVASRRRKETRFDRGFLTTTAVVKEIHEALKSSAPEGVRWRVYVLRSYCSTRLLMAEGAGKITRDLREAILGHDGGISARYNVGKRWGEELLKEARASYKRAEPFLSTTGKTEDSQEAVTRALRLLLTARGVPAEKLEGLDLAGKSDEEIVSLLKTVGAAIGPERRPEMAVSVGEVRALLDAGWEFVSPLNGEMAVVRAPLPVPFSPA